MRIWMLILFPILIYFLLCAFGVFPYSFMRLNINFGINTFQLIYLLLIVESPKVRKFSLKKITFKSIKNYVTKFNCKM